MPRRRRSTRRCCSTRGSRPTCFRWCGRCGQRPTTPSAPCGRLAGVDLPTFSNNEATIPELKDRIAKTIEFLKSLKPGEVDGTEDKEIKITFPSGASREFTGQSLLLNNSLPNFYFHCTTAYDIVRHCGVELGKRDFMGTPVQL